MRKFRKYAAAVLCLVLAMAATLLVACGEKEITVTMNKSAVTIGQFETYQLTADVTGSSDAVTWSSSNENVATVSTGGLVTASNEGTATITAAIGEVKATCEITVEAANPLPSLNISVTSVTVKKGKTSTVTATMRYKGEDISDKVTFGWEIADTAKATVNGGVVTGVAMGNTTLKVTADYMGYKTDRTINVVVEENVSMSISEESITVYTDNEYIDDELVTSVDLSVEIFENDVKVTSPTVVWSVDTAGAEYVAVTATGTVTAVKGGGTATVTASWVSAGGVTYTKDCAVSTSLPVIEREGTSDIDLSLSAVTLDLSKYTGIDISEFELSDKEADKKIAFTKNESILTLTKANLVRGERVFRLTSNTVIYEIEVVVADKILKTAQDVMDIKTFGTVTLEKKLVNSKDREDWDKNKELFAFEAYFVLGNNIDMSGKVIGTDFTIEYGDDFYYADYGFSGTLDGRGYTLYGGQYVRGGLFGSVARNSVIKNIAFTRVEIGGPFAGLFGTAFCGTLENVLMDVYVSDGGASGVLGYANGDLVMKNCVIYCDDNVKDASDRAISGSNANTAASPFKPIVMENVYVISNLDLSSSGNAGLETNSKYAFGTKCGAITFTGLDSKYWVTDGDVVMFKNWADFGKAELAKIGATASAEPGEPATFSFSLGDMTLAMGTIDNQYKDFVEIDGNTVSIVGTTAASFSFTVDLVWNGYAAAKKTVTISATSYNIQEVADVEYELYTGLGAEDARIKNTDSFEVDLSTYSVTFDNPTAVIIDAADTRIVITATVVGDIVTLALPDDIKGGEYLVEIKNGNTVYKAAVTLWNRIFTDKDDIKKIVKYADDVTQSSTDAFVSYYINNVIYTYYGYFKLGDNIDFGTDEVGMLTSTDGNDVGRTRGFHGKFDGNGYALTGGEYTQGGLLGFVSNEGIVENLAITGATLGAKTFSSIIAGAFHGTLDNVLVEISDVVTAQHAGGLTARGVFGLFTGSTAKISNSMFYLDGKTGMNAVDGNGDGVFGHYGDAVFENCYTFSDYLNPAGIRGEYCAYGESKEGVTSSAYATDVSTLTLAGFDADLWDFSGSMAAFKTAPAAVITVTISEDTATVEVDETHQLSATVKGTNQIVRWFSSDESIATVDATGLVTALNEGMVTITASAGGVDAPCEITVPAPVYNTETLDAIEYELYTGLNASNERVKNTGIVVDLSSFSDTISSPRVALVDADSAKTMLTVSVNESVLTLTVPDGVNGGEYTLEINNGTTKYTADITLWNRIFTDKDDIKKIVKYADDVVESTTNQFSAFYINNVIYTYKGYFKLGDNIDFGNDDVGMLTSTDGFDSPSSTRGFSGLFDGNGYALTGGVYTQGGLLGFVGTGGVVQNLAVTDVTLGGKTFASVIASAFYGKLDNVLVDITAVLPAERAGVLTARGVFGLLTGGSAKINNSVFYVGDATGVHALPSGGDGVFAHYGSAVFENSYVFTDYLNTKGRLGEYCDNTDAIAGVTTSAYETDISTLTLADFDDNLWNFTGSKAAFKAAPYGAVEVTVNTASIMKEVGEKYQLRAKVFGINKNIQWASSDDTVATVDGNGLVTAVAAGTATITASAGGVDAPVTVTVPTASTTTETLSAKLEYQLYTGLGDADARIKNTAAIEVDLSEYTVNWENTRAAIIDAAGTMTVVQISVSGSVVSVTVPDTAKGGVHTVEIISGATKYTVEVTLWNRIFTDKDDIKKLIKYADDVVTETREQAQWPESYVTPDIYTYHGYFKLGNNIDFGTDEVGTGTRAESLEWRATVFGFHGLFDGDGYTLTGGVYTQGGLFGLISKDGTVKNLAITGATLGSKSFSGIIANSLYGTIDNVLVDVTSVATADAAGALTARGVFGLFTGSTAKINNSIFYLDGEEGMNLLAGHGDGVFSHFGAAVCTNSYIFTDYVNTKGRLGEYCDNTDAIDGLTSSAYATDVSTLTLVGFDVDLWDFTGTKAVFKAKV